MSSVTLKRKTRVEHGSSCVSLEEEKHREGGRKREKSSSFFGFRLPLSEARAQASGRWPWALSKPQIGELTLSGNINRIALAMINDAWPCRLAAVQRKRKERKGKVPRPEASALPSSLPGSHLSRHMSSSRAKRMDGWMRE